MAQGDFGCHRDAGSIPSPAQWVEDPTLLQLWCRLKLWLDLIPGPGTPCALGWPKKENKKITKRKIRLKKINKRKIDISS